jgi:methylthioribulose-1-phosphate dehydratase
MNVHPAIAAIISAGRALGERGLLPASSGNLSIRVDDGSVAITRTGTEKAELAAGDVAIIDLRQSPPPGTSAETGLHLAQYRADPHVGAILHVHSLASTVLSNHYADRSRIVFRGYELQKAIRGVKTHDIDVILPIFANSQDIPALAETVLAGLSGRPEVFGYLLAGHGLYAWGKDADEARRHVVAFEFLLNCELEKLRIRAAGGSFR